MVVFHVSTFILPLHYAGGFLLLCLNSYIGIFSEFIFVSTFVSMKLWEDFLKMSYLLISKNLWKKLLNIPKNNAYLTKNYVFFTINRNVKM